MGFLFPSVSSRVLRRIHPLSFSHRRISDSIRSTVPARRFPNNSDRTYPETKERLPWIHLTLYHLEDNCKRARHYFRWNSTAPRAHPIRYLGRRNFGATLFSGRSSRPIARKFIPDLNVRIHSAGISESRPLPADRASPPMAEASSGRSSIIADGRVG